MLHTSILKKCNAYKGNCRGAQKRGKDLMLHTSVMNKSHACKDAIGVCAPVSSVWCVRVQFECAHQCEGVLCA